MTSPSPYADLLSQLDGQIDRTARFVPAAFHVHSIGSYDWARDGDAQRNDKTQFSGPAGHDRFLDELVAAGLGIVCITDHMHAGYACELAQRAAARGDIAILPGMEVSCSVPPAHRENIHVLVIFPADATADVIERLFADTGLAGAANRRGQESVRFPSLRDVRQRVDNAGGLFVLAHIDQDPRGHRCYVRSVRGETAQMFGRDGAGKETIVTISTEYAEHLADLSPHAVEVMHSEDRPHYWGFRTTDGRQHSFPCLARSDHHDVESMSTADAITHVKVSRRDLECVARALVFHETRLRFTADLPKLPSPRLVGLRVRGTGDGLFADAVIAFNENLNCLIGPRGSGKSTIVEALRYVLGQRSLLEQGGLGGGEGGSYAGLALATQAANLRDCEIELIYEHESERRVLAATYDADKIDTTRVFTLDGTDCHIGSEVLQSSFPATIFSWGELETLGRQPRLQRMVVDRLARGLPALQQRQDALRAALASNRRRVGEIRSELEALLAAEQGVLRRHIDYKLAFERLNTDEVAVLFTDLDRVRARIDMLRVAEEELNNLTVSIEALRQHKPQAAIAELLEQGSRDLQAWWAAEVAPLIQFDGLTTLFESQIERMLSEVSKRRRGIITARGVQQSVADAAEEALREQTHSDPGTSVHREQREQARRLHERATELRASYVATFETFEAVLATRNELLDELAGVRANISSMRTQTAEDLVGQLRTLGEIEQRISIRVTHDGDRATLTAYLDEFLTRERGGHYRERELPERLAQMEPKRIVDAILSGRPEDLVAGEASLQKDEADRLVMAFEVYSIEEGADVRRVSAQLDELLILQEQPVDDLVSILSDDQPVHKLSPGGRSSAMLPLIALSDNVPLIIDQPEDNLDNRMVGQTLSSILSRLKERRQIVVTTHNPNIVVGGDAEQVVVLDAPAARSARVELTGSIDDDDVIDAVIKIMEGGREAFEERHRRYRDRLGA